MRNRNSPTLVGGFYFFGTFEISVLVKMMVESKTCILDSSTPDGDKNSHYFIPPSH